MELVVLQMVSEQGIVALRVFCARDLTSAR
jgi:hypothetical protein